MFSYSKSPEDPEAEANLAPLLEKIREGLAVEGVGVLGADGRWLTGLEPDPPRIDPESLPPLGLAGVEQRPGRSRSIVAVPLISFLDRAGQWLVLWDERPRTSAALALLHARAGLLAAHAGMDRMRRLEALRRTMFERAMSTAQMGLWTCMVPGNDLVWSDGVYDLFELERGSEISRSAIVEMYEPESRREMEFLRNQALASGGDFALDAAIVTAKGRRRWIRITASVERLGSQAARLFGVKQDITTEKLMAEHTRVLAETDALTGLANRALFQRRLSELVAGAGANAALLLVDLDHFKTINDELGHAQGDACLVEAAARLRHSCPMDALVARIGGDEFAVLLPHVAERAPARVAAEVVEAFRTPFTLAGRPVRVGCSVGIAAARGHSGEALYHDADTALYAAKAAGRNTWRLAGAA